MGEFDGISYMPERRISTLNNIEVGIVMRNISG